uniref:Uncharacterized protein n=1 Tax=Panagrolaimus sp. PS1159 TaxID=55785 RepID=A0AC35GN37_9BILA
MASPVDWPTLAPSGSAGGARPSSSKKNRMSYSNMAQMQSGPLPKFTKIDQAAVTPKNRVLATVINKPVGAERSIYLATIGERQNDTPSMFSITVMTKVQGSSNFDELLNKSTKGSCY